MTTDKDSMEHVTARVKERVKEASGLLAHTYAVEKNIVKAAIARLEKVTADLERIRRIAETDAQAAERYQALTLERGRLETVIAKGRETLG